MTTPDPALTALAYGLYTAWQRGAGIFATGEPLPTKAWNDLRDCDRERYLRRAMRFRQNAHLRPALRFYESWPECAPHYTKPWDRISPGLRALWATVAEEWAALEAERRAA